MKIEKNKKKSKKSRNWSTQLNSSNCTVNTAFLPIERSQSESLKLNGVSFKVYVYFVSCSISVGMFCSSKNTEEPSGYVCSNIPTESYLKYSKCVNVLYSHAYPG